MALRKNFKNFISQYLGSVDVPLLAAVAAICLFSIINLYGITGPDNPIFRKHILLIVIGIVVMVAFSFFNYRYLKNYSFPVLGFYLISVALLGFTFYSSSIRGVRAWLSFGGFTLEPSELATLAVIILFAKYFSQRHIHINDFKQIVISGVYFILPFIIIFMQPDLGGAVVLGLVWLGMLLAAGISPRHIFLLVIVGVTIGFLAWMFALHAYQRERIVSFLNPSLDPRGVGYNLIQSKIAIGSGYLFGSGLGKGSQSTLGFLPESHNDFVFAALTEQFGFAGALLALGLIWFIVERIFRIGLRTTSNFGKLFAMGIGIFISAHVIVSTGVNVGLMPVTGLPFSFLSYGGSHLISVMIGIGLLQSIKRYG